MAYVRKEMFLGRHRLMLPLVAIAIGAFIIFRTRLLEALMSLVFAGSVPGTDIVLSPDMMLLGAASAIWLIFGILIIRAVILRNRRGRHAWSPANYRRDQVAKTLGKQLVVQSAAAEDAATAPQVLAAPKPAAAMAQAVLQHAAAPPKPLKNTRKSKLIKRQRGTFLHPFHRAGLAVWMAIRLGIATTRVVLFALGRGAVAVGRSFVAGFVGAAQFAWATLLFLEAAIIRLGLWVLRLANDIWRWAEPHLWKFDTWLELQVQGAEAWTRRQTKRSPRLQVWAAHLSRIRRIMRNLSFRLAFKPVPGAPKARKLRAVSSPIAKPEQTQPPAHQ